MIGLVLFCLPLIYNVYSVLPSSGIDKFCFKYVLPNSGVGKMVVSPKSVLPSSGVPILLVPPRGVVY